MEQSAIRLLHGDTQIQELLFHSRRQGNPRSCKVTNQSGSVQTKTMLGKGMLHNAGRRERSSWTIILAFEADVQPKTVTCFFL